MRRITTLLPVAIAACLAVTLATALAAQNRATVRPDQYRGWKSLAMSNRHVELQVTPALGGRIAQFTAGGKAWLWVNAELAGKSPPAGGVGSKGEWLNYGGDKLWPAPQGWDHDAQWPGPPGAVLDGLPYRIETLDEPGVAAVRLTSGDDPQTGVRFSRTIRLAAGSTRVQFEAAMTNVDSRPRRWGLWSHTQLDASRGDSPGPNVTLVAWCPLNPKSRFPRGYTTIFGDEDHPAFVAGTLPGLLRVEYRYQVGKIGVDSAAGWVATVDGTRGDVLVQRAAFEPGRDYPDGASVEYWLNGPGRIPAYRKFLELPDDPKQNPYVLESELVSPYAKLEPGETYRWRYEWAACNIGGPLPVLGCSDAGVVTKRLTATRQGDKLKLTGQFGVFAAGTARLDLFDAAGRRLQLVTLPGKVSPQRPLIVDVSLNTPRQADRIALRLADAAGHDVGTLAELDLAHR